MLKMRKITLVTVLAFVLIFSAFSVFADTEQSVLSKVTGLSDDAISELRTQRIGYGQLIPASVLASALDMNIEDVLALRQAGKSYYQIAADKGIDAEDFKNDLLEKKNVFVDEQIKAGNLTSEQGKLVKERMSTNIENCNGQTPGLGRINGGCGIGAGFNNTGMGGFSKGRGFGRNVQ
jgi:hypothetical protein